MQTPFTKIERERGARLFREPDEMHFIELAGAVG